MKLGQFFQKVASGSMVLAALACPVFTSCYDDTALNEAIEQVKQEVEEIKGTLEALDQAAKAGLSIKEYNQIEGGYELVFTDGSKINIYNGADGEDGAKGDKGEKGDTGAAGTPGTPGAQGPQGEQGEKGDTGEAGTPGQQGPQGPQGEQGEQGEKGDKGEDGDAFFESVELSEDEAYLVITLIGGTVYELPLDVFNIVFNIENGQQFVDTEAVTVGYELRGATRTDVVVRKLNSENCVVEIDQIYQEVTITPGFGEGFVDIYVINQLTGEIKAKTISFNADAYFKVEATEYAVSPLGGNVEVPVTTTAEAYDIIIDSSWLTYVETKAKRTETVVLTAVEGNTTGEERVATVTMKLKNSSKVLASFTVTQKSYNAELIGKEYVESYVWQYASHTGTLSIALSDAPEKGVYKLTMCGGEVYADIEGTTLKVYSGKYSREFVMSDDYQTITYPGSAVDLPHKNSVSQYKAFLPLGEAQLTESEEALVGTYNEAWTNDGTSLISNGGMVISASEEAAFGQLKVKFLTYSSSYFEGYASLVDNALTVEIGGQSHSLYSTPQYESTCAITLTVNADGTISLASHTKLYGLADYVATKTLEQGGEEPEEPAAGVTVADLVGTTWSETFVFGETFTGTMTISATDDNSKGQLKVRMLAQSSYYLDCYADLSSDGTTLTAKAKGVVYQDGSPYAGESFADDFVLIVSENGTKLQLSNQPSTNWYRSVTSYTATKQ